MSGSDGYEVGYKKPPTHTRFGAANGNGRGRGRKSRNLKTDLLEELGERVSLKANGKSIRLTQQRALVKSLVVNGIKGDVRAAAKLFDLLLRIVGADDGITPTNDLSIEDQAILDSFRQRERNDDVS